VAGVDWWRTKWLLILAFAALDALLLLQAARMRLPVLPAPARAVLALSASRPPDLPVLQVQTQAWQAGDEALLGGAPRCRQHLGSDQAVLAVTCSTQASAEQLAWIGGALQYVAAAGLPAGGTARQAAGFASRLASRLSPRVPASAFAAVRLHDPGGWLLTASESYAGRPLFNGYWAITLRPRSVVALRVWLQVLGAAGPPERIVSPSAAATAAARVYGRAALVAAGQQPQLGYYSASLEPPGAPQPWDVFPVYRFRLAGDQCVYVDALAGGPSADAGPGPQEAVPLSPQPC
jgi:hypothetical protein